MILLKSRLDVADNSGARQAQCIHVLGQRKTYAHIGDIIKVAIKEAHRWAWSRKAKCMMR